MCPSSGVKGWGEARSQMGSRESTFSTTLQEHSFATQ